MSDGFFDESLYQSKIKGQIVAEYFPAWAKILQPRAKKGGGGRIGYVDLYAGPGRYKDNTDSTPLLILKATIAKPEIAKNLVCIFNDKDLNHINLLKDTVGKLTGAGQLRIPPNFLNLKISDKILDSLQDIEEGESFIPTFFFLDPWGYKGLSLKLVEAAISAWGCECLFFFNYNRINMSLRIRAVQEEIDVLFGKSTADTLRECIQGLAPYDRELAIVTELCKALKGRGGKHVLPFCFKAKSRNRTSHYLMFVGKHARGFGLMKEIMAKHSQKDRDGVPSYTFDPKPQTQLEFSFNRPLLELKDSLVKTFKGHTLSVEAIYNSHQKQTRFIWKNYTKSLKMLEEEGKISVDKPPAKRIRKGEVTLGPKRLVTFHK